MVLRSLFRYLFHLIISLSIIFPFVIYFYDKVFFARFSYFLIILFALIIIYIIVYEVKKEVDRVKVFNILIIFILLSLVLSLSKFSYDWWRYNSNWESIHSNVVTLVNLNNGISNVYYQTKSLTTSTQALLLASLSFIIPLFLFFGIQRANILINDYRYLLNLGYEGKMQERDLKCLKNEIQNDIKLFEGITSAASNYFYGGIIIGVLLLMISVYISLRPAVDFKSYWWVPLLNAIAVVNIIFLLCILGSALGASRPMKRIIELNRSFMEVIE